jgi:hypothetical protein
MGILRREHLLGGQVWGPRPAVRPQTSRSLSEELTPFVFKTNYQLQLQQPQDQNISLN